MARENRVGPLNRWAWIGLAFVCGLVCVLFVEVSAATHLPPSRSRETLDLSDSEQESANSRVEESSAKVEEPEPGVKLYGDATSIALTAPGLSWTTSNDGSILVLGSRAPTLYFWSLLENRVLYTIERPEGNAMWFPSRYAASGKVLAATYQTWQTPDEDQADDDAASPWSTSTTTTVLFIDQAGRVRSEVEIADAFRTQRPRDIAFSPDERRFLLGGARMTTVVDVESGEIIAQRPDFPDPVFLDDTRVVSVSRNELWNVDTGDVVPAPVSIFPRNSQLNVTSSDCRQILINVQGQGAMLVSLPDGKRTPISKIQGYMGGNFSPDGRYLAVSGYGFGGNDRCWLVYDIEQETVVGDVISDMAMIGICGNRRQLLVWHGAMRTIDLDGAATIAEQWERIRNSPIQANRLQFGNQNQTLVGGQGQFSFDLPALQFERLDQYSTTLQPLLDQPSFIFVNHREPGLPGFHNEQQYAVARYDVPEGKLSKLYKIGPRTSILAGARSLLTGGPQAPPTLIESRGFFVSVDSSKLYDVRAESGRGMFVKSYDLQANKPLEDQELEIPKDKVQHNETTVTMSGDLRKIAVANDRLVWLVDSQTGRLEEHFQLARKPLQLRLNDNGSRLAVVYSGRRADESRVGKEFAVYDTAAHRTLYSQTTDTILALEFHPQRPQLMLATQGQENRLEHLDADQGRQLKEQKSSYAVALSAGLASDGKQIAWGLVDTRVEVWDLDRKR